MRFSPSGTTRTRKRIGLKKPAVALAMLATSLGGVTATATPASAALPGCTNYIDWSKHANGYRHEWATPAINSAIDCVLRRGNTGGHVLVLQQSLIRCYNANITESGYGRQTELAVMWVQGSLGLSADGIFGPRTNRAMKWYGRSTSSTRTVGPYCAYFWR